jgi:3D (Asp-Asp-Asp) domain-containing protein
VRHLAWALSIGVLALGGCTVGVGAPPLAPPAAPAPEPAPVERPLPEVVAVPVMTSPEPVGLPEPAAGAAAGELRMGRRMDFRATAYCLRGTMRTGVRVRDGMAAGDPAVLPLGTVVRVSHPDGRLVGYFVIMDTGGAVRGNRIDLWMASCADAREWGVRSVAVEVVATGRR